jgi:hypothetical protein
VSVIDSITHRVTNTLDVGGHPEGSAVSPDDDRPYVSDYWAGSVSVISTRERNPAGASVIRVLERASPTMKLVNRWPATGSCDRSGHRSEAAPIAVTNEAAAASRTANHLQASLARSTPSR